MTKTHLLIAVTLIALAPAPGYACTLLGPSPQEVVSEVAEDGAFIRGTIIQAFDAKRRQPEIIRANKVFIGNRRMRYFTIYYTETQYISELPNLNNITTSCGPPYHHPLGHTYDRLLLGRARGPDGKNQAGWRFFMTGISPIGRGVDLLVDAAKKTGRFLARPVPDRQWGD